MGWGDDVLETIDLLYRAAVEPELWRPALHRLALATGGVGSAMIPITPGNTTGLVVSEALDEPNVEYAREWWRHDTRVARIYSRKLRQGVCCETELFTSDEVARDPLRQEFLRSYGIGAFAAQLVAPLPGLVVAFSVQRALERGEFSRRGLENLALLGRHAARALVISTRIGSVRGLEQTISDMVGRVECAVLLIDREQRILLANAAAEDLLGDGLALSRGRLRASSKAHQKTFARFLRSVLGAERGADDALETIALPRPSGRLPILLQGVPISAANTGWGLPNNAAGLLIAVDPERDARPDLAHELQLLGLTRAEARLATLIGRGASRGEAAAELGISELTASDTVKRIYAKLGFSRQSQLVRLLDRLAVLRRQRRQD